MKITRGAAVLLEALRHRWNIGIVLPIDFRRIDDEGAIRTELRAGKATDVGFTPAGTWTARDGIVLLKAGLLRYHGKGETYLPAEHVNQDLGIEIVEDDAQPLLRNGPVTSASCHRDRDGVELHFGIPTADSIHGRWTSQRTALVGFSLKPGEYRTVRRVIEGGPVDRIEVDHGVVARLPDGGVTITKSDSAQSIDLVVTGTALAQLRALIEDSDGDDYDATIGFTVPGATYI